MSVPKAVYLCFLTLVAPSKFTELEGTDDETLRKSPSFPEGNAFKIRRAIFSALLLVIGAGALGALIAKILELSYGPASRGAIVGLQVAGASILLWATLAVRGWEIQSFGGVRLSERVNRWIYRFLYSAGTAILVCSVVWTSGRRGQGDRWASEVPMTGYEIVSSVLLLSTLIVLIVYTAKTATIARAAIEQSEAAQKPCVIVSAPWMGREGTEHEDRAVDWTERGPSLMIWNFGNGPALKVDFEFLDAPPEAHANRKRRIPILVTEWGPERKPEKYPTGCAAPRKGMVEFCITYESMSGTKYETRTAIVDGEYVADFKFGRHLLRD